MAAVSAAEEVVGQRYSLSKLEEEYLSMLEGVKTMTFFQGSSTKLVAYLKARLPLIATANPWLVGSIDKAEPPKKGHEIVVPLPASAAIKIVNYCLSEANMPDISISTPYHELVEKLKQYKVKNGAACAAGTNEPLFKIVVFSGSSDEQCALYFDLSHVLADGHSYYQIFNMLSEGSEIKSLNPERKVGFGLTDEPCQKLLGKEESSLGMSGAYTCMLMSRFMCGKKRHPKCYMIDPEKIKAAKAEVANTGQTKFVSTNDLATSSIGVATRTNFMEMALNLRGRLEDRKLCLFTTTFSSCYYPDAARLTLKSTWHI